jgi:hypothetical protein
MTVILPARAITMRWIWLVSDQHMGSGLASMRTGSHRAPDLRMITFQPAQECIELKLGPEHPPALVVDVLGLPVAVSLMRTLS